MSRSATAVRQVIKAYDVRGLVGEEINEPFVAAVGAAFAFEELRAGLAGFGVGGVRAASASFPRAASVAARRLLDLFH